MRQHRLYKFGPFSLDATAKVLLKDDQPVPVTRKVVETLLVLVENAGQVVPKEEMISSIWPDRVVDEANLTQNIAMVRRALGAEPHTPAYIETFPGRGYRLIGPVMIVTPPVHEEGSIFNGEATFAPNPPLSPALIEPVAGLSRPRRTKLKIFGFIALCLILTALALWFLTLRKRGDPGDGFHIAAQTRLPGKERQPAISADGRKLAFLWEKDDGTPPEIRIQTASESSTQEVTRAPGHYSSPAWSPDGQALVYLRIGKSSSDVVINTLVTGHERSIVSFTPPNYGDQHRLLDWSPDGQWLVVSHSAQPDKPNGLFLIRISTGEKTPLTMPESMVGGDMDPRFSPDGRKISFIRNIHRSHQELFAVSISGGEPRRLTDDGKRISSHDWTANGDEIVFASDRGGEFRLWRMNAGVTEPERNPRQVGVYGEFPIELSLARKAESMVYSALQQDRNIWRLDLKEKKWTRIIASTAQDASPQYSPTGEKICFRSDRSGEEQLWISDADGGNQTQITRGASYPSVGRWSPDGRRIVFNNARSGEVFIAAQSANGDDASWTVSSAGFNGVHPVFSPDGKWIYVGGTTGISRAAADGGQPIELVKTGGFSLGLPVNGRWLYFMRETNETTLWRLNLDRGDFTKALGGLVPKCTSCWALTDDGIYYLGSSKESFDAQSLYFHDFATGKDREIIRYPEPLAPVGSGPFSISPDLRYLLCVRVDPSNCDIMRVEPFR